MRNEEICDTFKFGQIAHLHKGGEKNIMNSTSESTEAVNHSIGYTPIEVSEYDLNSSRVVPEKRCYTVEDIQAILNISRPSVYKLINQNLFHTVKIVGKYRISKKSFDEWFDKLE